MVVSRTRLSPEREANCQIELHHRMAAERSTDFTMLKGIIDKAMADWAAKWATQIECKWRLT